MSKIEKLFKEYKGTYKPKEKDWGHDIDMECIELYNEAMEDHIKDPQDISFNEMLEELELYEEDIKNGRLETISHEEVKEILKEV